MILTGPAIAKAIDDGEIRITPFDPESLNPNSYDLRLGKTVRTYRSVVSHLEGAGANSEFSPRNTEPLDVAKENTTHCIEMPDTGFLLEPGVGYLMSTAETIWSDTYVPVLDGKSSIGRLFIWVHFTAAYGDRAFDGQYTLEVAVLHPVIVRPGMKFAQARFHLSHGEKQLYSGNYQGEDARGPVASKSWKQFQGKVTP